jgi:site-specific DNA recombinase
MVRTADPTAALRVVGYVRVSTEEQASEGVSLAAQEEKVRGFAKLHDLDLVAVEIDAGVSAKSLARPALVRALVMLDEGQSDGMVITKLDRLSRSVSDWNDLIRSYFGPEAGKQLFSVGDSIDTTKAAGRLVLNVLMSVAQWERESTVERVRDAMAYKRSRSERVGPIPFGFDLHADGKTLVPNPAEQVIIADIRAMHAAGSSTRAIAAELGRRGVPTKRGNAAWVHTAVAKILARPQP